MGKSIRLDKYLADSGRWSRKEARELIRQGRVRVGEAFSRTADSKLDPERDRVTVDGAPVGWQEHLYLMLNKPAGYLTATEDRKDSTVLDLVPPAYRRAGLAPVGRLDKDTVGLLLLTDNGPMAHHLLSPKRHVDKVYLAWVEGEGGEADVAAFRAGLTLGDGTRCLPAELELLGPGLCRVTLREGKFHQVKRMLAARGLPVQKLKRLSMGPLSLDPELPEGAVRPLTPQELEALEALCR